MLLESIVKRPVRRQWTVFFGDFLAHRHGDIPWPVTIAAHAAEFLAHQTICAGVHHLFQLRRDRIETMKHPLRHQPARFRRVTLKFVVLIGWTFFFRPRHILHRIGRPMAITRAAKHTTAAALVKCLGIKPFFNSFESQRFVVFVCHEN